MLRWIMMALVVSTVLGGSPAARAQHDDPDDLKKQVEQLQQRVDELEKKGKQRDTLLDTVVTKGVAPGAVKLPGTDISVKFGGFVKLNLIHDFDPIENDSFKNLFATATIPVEGTPEAEGGGRTSLDVRETRLNLTARSTTPWGNLKVFVEGDFQDVDGGFRLRHAYGEAGHFLAGQTNSTFMDDSAQPATLDNEGPGAMVFMRHPLVRWTQPLAPGLTWAISIEESETTITDPFSIQPAGPTRIPSEGDVENLYPDLATHFRYAASFGHVQIAGLLRDLRYDGAGGSPDESVTGWGLNFTGLISSFGLDAFMFQAAYGKGIGVYIQDLNFETPGQGNDAAPSATGNLEAVPALGAFAAYEHWWTESLRSVATYGFVDVDNTDGQAGNAYRRTHYTSINLIWSPFRLVSTGVEFLYGKRRNKDGAEGEANRLQFAVTYYFN